MSGQFRASDLRAFSKIVEVLKCTISAERTYERRETETERKKELERKRERGGGREGGRESKRKG